MPNQQNTPMTYSDMEYREFSADSIYMKGDQVILGDKLYVCLKNTNHLASAPEPPENEYWQFLYNFNEEETDSDAAAETPDTAPLLLPEDSKPVVTSVPLQLSEESGAIQQVAPLVSTVTVAPKKKGGKKK